MTPLIWRFVRLAAIVSLIVLGAASAPATFAGNPCFHGFEMPPAATGPGTDIKLMPCAFEPTVTTVAVGAEVTFRNGPDFTHLITGANQAWGSSEVEVKPNTTVSYTFDTAGVYPYACALHPGMSGAIVVGDLAEALSAGTTGASTTDGSAATASAANATSETTASTSLTLAAGALAGLLVGAAAVWLAVRRRSVVDRTPVRAD